MILRVVAEYWLYVISCALKSLVLGDEVKHCSVERRPRSSSIPLLVPPILHLLLLIVLLLLVLLLLLPLLLLLRLLLLLLLLFPLVLFLLVLLLPPRDLA